MNVNEMEGSPSLEVVNLVLQKLARGEKLTSLAIGEPMYNTPEEIINVAFESMKNGETHYTSSYGIMPVREAIIKKVAKKNDIKAELENVMFITTKQAIHAAFMALAGKRGKILLPNPGYFYTEPAQLAGFQPEYYALNADYSLNMNDIKSKINNDTAAIMINSPSNPTSKVLAKDDLKELFEVCREKGVKIISDEAYEDLVYDSKHFSIGSLEEKPDVVISLFSLSKSYSMTGWRAGYSVANPRITVNMARVIEHTYTCSPPFIQKASAYALENGDKFIENFKKEFREKRDFVTKRLSEIDKLEANPIEGAFYAFPKYSKEIKSTDFSKQLLEKHGVAVLPGFAFGPAGEKHIRISFSGSVESVETGLNEIEKYLKN